MMKVDTSYKFYVIEFLQSPFRNIDDFVCVPTTWIEDRGSKGIYAAYPAERLPTTKSIVKSRQDYDKEWKFYLCTPKYGTNCLWDAENIICVESSKKQNVLLGTPKIHSSKQSGAQENKPKIKPKMTTRDELTQSLKRKVSIDCSKNRKVARIESATDVPDPTNNLSVSEKKTAICKDLAVMVSRLPEIHITKSKAFNKTDNKEQKSSDCSYVEKTHPQASESSKSSSGNNHTKSVPEKEDDDTNSSSSSSLLKLLKETPYSVDNRKNSTSSRPASHSGQLTTNTTNNVTTSSSVIVESNSSPSKINVNPHLQSNINNSNPPDKAKKRRKSVRNSTDLNTSDNIEILANGIPEGIRSLLELNASGTQKGVDKAVLQNYLKTVQEFLLHKQDVQATPQPLQAAQVTPPATQAAKVTLQAVQAVQIAPKQAQTINNTSGIPYTMTANTPILYQDPHEQQIITERSTVTNIIDPNVSQSRTHNVSNFQNVSNLQYSPYSNQVYRTAPQRQDEQQIRANGHYANQFNSSSSPVSGRVSDRSNTTYRPLKPKFSVPSNVQMANLQQQNYAIHAVAVGANAPQISKTIGSKNQMPSNIQVPYSPQQNYAVHPVPIAPKMPQPSNLINVMPNTSKPNHPHHSSEYSHQDRYQGYNYSHSEAQLRQHLLHRSETGRTHPSLGGPMPVVIQNHLHTYPPNAADHLRQLQNAHVNNAVISQAHANYPHQVPHVQENITVRPRSNDTIHQIPNRHDMPQNIPTAVHKISNPESNSDGKNISANILNNSNQIENKENRKDEYYKTSVIIENGGEKALSTVGSPNVNTDKSPCDSVKELPVCNEITNDNDVPEEIPLARSSSADTVKIDQIDTETGDVLIELTNKINSVLSPTFRAQIEVSLIKHFGKVFEIMSNNFAEILNVLDRDQKVIKKKKAMLDKTLKSISSYLAMQNEHSAIALKPKPLTRSQKIIKKIKNKKRRKKDVDDENNDTSDDDDWYANDDSDSSYDDNEHDNDDSDSSDDHNGHDDDDSESSDDDNRHDNDGSGNTNDGNRHNKDGSNSSDDDNSHDNDGCGNSNDGNTHDNNGSGSFNNDNDKNIEDDISSISRNDNKLDGKKSISPKNYNENSEGKTEVKTKDDKKTADEDGDDISKPVSNNHNEETIMRGKRYPFVLPREYSPKDSRWTLLHRRPNSETTELLPKSRIYVNAIKLAHCKRHSSSYKELARMLLQLIFKQSALNVCSWTGARANAFAMDKYDVRPGLDEHARQVMLVYVEKVGRKKKWGMYDKQSVINSIRAKIQDARKIFNKELKNQQ